MCCRRHEDHESTRWQRFRDDSIRKVAADHRCEICGRDDGPGIRPYRVAYPGRGCQGCGYV